MVIVTFNPFTREIMKNLVVEITFMMKSIHIIQVLMSVNIIINEVVIRFIRPLQEITSDIKNQRERHVMNDLR